MLKVISFMLMGAKLLICLPNDVMKLNYVRILRSQGAVKSLYNGISVKGVTS